MSGRRRSNGRGVAARPAIRATHTGASGKRRARLQGWTLRLVGNPALISPQVFLAAKLDKRAHRVFAEGRDWVRRVASEHVPGEYRQSFLHRNPVNLALLAAAQRTARDA